jgi:hypothetical protein
VFAQYGSDHITWVRVTNLHEHRRKIIVDAFKDRDHFKPRLSGEYFDIVDFLLTDCLRVGKIGHCFVHLGCYLKVLSLNYQDSVIVHNPNAASGSVVYLILCRYKNRIENLYIDSHYHYQIHLNAGR